MRSRPGTTVADLRAMQELTQRLWSLESRWHIGDLAWQRNAVPDTGSTALWEDDGKVLAWGWSELPAHLSLVVDPGRPDLAAEVLAWFESTTSARELSCMVLEPEAHLVAALTNTGYQEDRAAPFFTHHHRPLGEIEIPALPAGFTLRHVRSDDAVRRTAGHLAAWTEFGSKVSVADYQSVMDAWPYRADLDWVVENQGGEFVATSLAWFDDQNKVGLIEPVGCAPAYRRQGLATAVNLAALTALREAGATQAIVCPRGDDAYPIAAKLYQSIGFRPGPRTATYTKHRT